jgi:hypothetical protein
MRRDLRTFRAAHIIVERRKCAVCLNPAGMLQKRHAPSLNLGKPAGMPVPDRPSLQKLGARSVWRRGAVSRSSRIPAFKVQGKTGCAGNASVI